MTDDRFLDIKEKINSIEYCIEQGIEREIVKSELRSYKWMLNKEIKRYTNAFNKANSFDIIKSDTISEGIKRKVTSMLSILYKVECILDNRES